jgi:hypothetical protein
MKNDCTLEATSSTRITDLRDLLGYDVLLLHWPLGSKGTKQKWRHLTIDDMSNPDYLAKLDSGNIGVALGEKSGHLCALDLDDDTLVDPFLESNPRLADTLQTHGARGRVFWLRMTGDYPGTHYLKTISGTDAGEWRGNGAQSIIAGIHPDTSQPYQFMVEQPPIEISYSEINFGCLDLQPGKSHSAKNSANAQTTFGSHPLTSVPIGSHVHICSHTLHPAGEEWESMVQASIPTAGSQNHRCLFDLARRLKGIEQRTGTSFESAQLKTMFKRWHELAVDYLRPGLTFDDYFFEFLEAIECVKYPAGEAVLADAWERAQKAEPPPEAMEIDSPDIRRMVALCRELQLRAGDSPFILPARVAQRLFRHDNHVQSWRWLAGLCRLGILQKVKAGSHAKREVNEYRYQFKYQSSNSKTI